MKKALEAANKNIQVLEAEIERMSKRILDQADEVERLREEKAEVTMEARKLYEQNEGLRAEYDGAVFAINELKTEVQKARTALRMKERT